MGKGKRKSLVNAALFLATTLIVISSIIIDNKAPFIILGLNRSSWVNLHIVFGLLMSLLIAVHLSRHLNWIKSALSRKIFNRNLWINGSSLLIFTAMLFSGLTLWLAKGNVTDDNSAQLTILNDLSSNGLRDIHGQGSIVLLTLMIIHLLMHRRWIVLFLKYRARI